MPFRKRGKEQWIKLIERNDNSCAITSFVYEAYNIFRSRLELKIIIQCHSLAIYFMSFFGGGRGLFIRYMNLAHSGYGVFKAHLFCVGPGWLGKRVFILDLGLELIAYK